MTKFNAIQFAATMSIDLTEELNGLDELIAKGAEKAEEIRSTYNHLKSLIQGMKYTVEFIADEETMNEVLEVLDDMESQLIDKRARCAEIIWSARTGKKVQVMTTCHADDPNTFELLIDGEFVEKSSKWEDIQNALKEYKD